ASDPALRPIELWRFGCSGWGVSATGLGVLPDVGHPLRAACFEHMRSTVGSKPERAMATERNATTSTLGLALAVSLAYLLVTAPREAFAQDVLPRPEPPFKGVIGQTYKDSKPDKIPLITAPKGAPNVLVVLIDDSGFGQWSTFGGLIPTPN